VRTDAFFAERMWLAVGRGGEGDEEGNNNDNDNDKNKKNKNNNNKTAVASGQNNDIFLPYKKGLLIRLGLLISSLSRYKIIDGNS
jgi:hypothetical protein